MSLQKMNMKFLILLIAFTLMSSTTALADIVVETTASGFTGSGGATVGPYGNIYVSDYGPRLSQGDGTTIWKITPDGQRTEFVTGLVGASGGEFDSQGDLYQSHLSGGTIRKMQQKGEGADRKEQTGVGPTYLFENKTFEPSKSPIYPLSGSIFGPKRWF